MNRRERRAAAAKSKRDTSASPAADMAVVFNAVVADLRAQKYLDAQIRCQRALEQNPENPELLHLMALVCFNAGQFEHAAEWALRAIAREPKPAYLTTLGTALLNLGRHDDALDAFTRAVQRRPDDAGLWNTLGNALIEAGRQTEAISSFQRALAIDPRHVDSTFKTGLLLEQQGRFQEALAYLNNCETLLPDQVATLITRARALYGLNRFEDALSDNRRAQALDPQNAYIHAHLAHALLELHRFEEAIAFHRTAHALDPSRVEAECSIGELQLLTGNFEAGWAGREARFRLPPPCSLRLQVPLPLWLGDESVDGKTVLLYSDEGLGDTIQFARYVPMLAARGARAIMVVEKQLCSLMSGVAGVTECLPKGVQSSPPFDLHCPIGSLPLAFQTRLDTVPAAPYLPPPAAERVQAWEQRLGARDRLRVGLVWSGNRQHKNDKNRSLPFHTLSPILEVDATFVSLQKDLRPDDQPFLKARSDVIDLTADLTDFTETAALVSCLDLVITVDTSVAHLAGALGRRTWILLPYTPDFRWLLDRDDSPWYPTMRLFRQDESRDYGRVIERVRAALAELVATR